MKRDTSRYIDAQRANSALVFSTLRHLVKEDLFSLVTECCWIPQPASDLALSHTLILHLVLVPNWAATWLRQVWESLYQCRTPVQWTGLHCWQILSHGFAPTLCDSREIIQEGCNDPFSNQYTINECLSGCRYCTDPVSASYSSSEEINTEVQYVGWRLTP